ncbi:MAG: acyl carrier protein [Bacteroidetes bacterium]|nr:acyl carrier protein [Bacteroidota bacterium]
MEELTERLKVMIIEHLNLEDITAEEIGTDESLYDGALGLDSIDVLELIGMLEQEFNCKIDNADIGRQVFRTVGSIANFIQSPENFKAA